MNSLLEKLRSRSKAGVTYDPVRDWLLLLLASGVFLIGVIGWNIWAFDTVTYGGALGSAVPAAAPIFDHSTLDAIHAIFQNRGDEELKYENGFYTFTDPSQ